MNISWPDAGDVIGAGPCLTRFSAPAPPKTSQRTAMIPPTDPEARPLCRTEGASGTDSLERELGRELELPRVENSSRVTEKRIRERRTTCGTRHLAKLDGRGGRVLVMRWNCATEVCRAIYGSHLVHICPVEHIENLGNQLQPHALSQLEIPSQVK